MEYRGEIAMFVCITDRYIFYVIGQVLGITNHDDAMVSNIRYAYPVCTCEEFESNYLVDNCPDDDIYLYLKVKGENQ